jgi:hypothetical protein
MSTVLLIVVAGILVYLFLLRPAPPWVLKKVKLSQLEPTFLYVIERMAKGTVVIIEEPRTRNFVQFYKDTSDTGDPALVFSFPDAPWSRFYFETLLRDVTSRGVAHRIVDTPTLETPRFLELPGITSAAHALEVARWGLENIGVDVNSELRVIIKGYVPWKARGGGA